MSYRIVIYKNNVRVKILGRSRVLKNIEDKFSDLIKYNEVIIPKKIVNNKKLTPANYELMILESKEVSNGDSIVRDRFGRIIRNREIEPGWLIVDRVNWEVEDTFKVFNYKERFTCKDIVKKLLLPNLSPKQICCVLNKLIIEDDNDNMEVITCKNEFECGRLHDTLSDICKNFKVKSILFFGKSTPENRSRLYPKILKVTGCKKSRVYRTSTRP